LNVENVEVAGELVTDVRIPGTVTLKSSGRLFGDVEAANLIVEPGAVLVGNVKIRPAAATTPAPSPATAP
jgi:cytoskeletal protein CcmA (bactofilin family)